MHTAFDTDTFEDLRHLWDRWTVIDADHAARLTRAYDDAMLREAWGAWAALDDEHAERLAETVTPHAAIRAA